MNESNGFHIGRLRIFSSSTLKLLACLFMLIDHAGLLLFPRYKIFRIIGRLAFPIFAYLIAEGCRYTRNKLKHFLLVFGLGTVCELVYIIYSGSAEGNILLTFSCSILLIYTVQFVKKSFYSGELSERVLSVLLFLITLILAAVASLSIGLDYGFGGVLLPVFPALFHYKEGETAEYFKRIDLHPLKLAVFTVAMLFVDGLPFLQMWSLLAVPLLALYNGKPGIRKFKYGFYIFYPAHLLLLEGLYLLLKT